MSQYLNAPWRMDYIRGIDKPADDSSCFVCQAATAQTPEEKKSRLVLWTTEYSVILINRYPYTNGHLLIAPKSHKADLEELSIDELTERTGLATSEMRTCPRPGLPCGVSRAM